MQKFNLIAHTLVNLIITEYSFNRTIRAAGIEGYSHIVLKVPCNENGLRYPQLPE